MKKDTHNLFLGIFVLCGMGLLLAAVTFLGARSLWEDKVLVETYIDESVHGLDVGSAVAFRGIKVGEVKEVTVVSQVYDTDLSYALVRAEVLRDSLAIRQGATVGDTFQERVINGLRVSLAPSGLTGGAYLETEYISDPSQAGTLLTIDWEPENIYVPSRESTLEGFVKSLESVLDNLSRTDIEGVVAAARDTLREFESSMQELDFGGLSNEAQSLMSTARATVERVGTDLDVLTAEVNTSLAEIRASLGVTLGEADTAFTTATTTFDKVNGVIDQSEIEASLARLSELLEQADDAVQGFDQLTKNADRAVVGAGQVIRGRSRELEVAISNLREILENINSLTGTLEEYPSLLFLGNPPDRAIKKEDR